MHPVTSDHRGIPSPGRQQKRKRRNTLATAKLNHTARLFCRCCLPSRVCHIPQALGQPACHGVRQILLPCHGVGLGADPIFHHPSCRPPSPRNTQPPSGPDHARWCCMVPALATNFCISLFPDDSFSLSRSFLLIVFFLFCAGSISCSMHALLFYPTCTHTHTHTHIQIFVSLHRLHTAV